MPLLRRTVDNLILFFQKLFRWVLYFDGNTHIKFKPITLSGANGYFIEFKYKGTSIDYRSVLINSATGKRICRFNLGGTFRFYSPDEASTVTGSISVTDNKEHVIRLEVYNGSATLLIDGQLDNQTSNASWNEDHVVDSSAPAGLAGYLYDINLNDEYEYIIDEGEGTITYNRSEPIGINEFVLPSSNVYLKVTPIENGFELESLLEGSMYPSVAIPITLGKVFAAKVDITTVSGTGKGFMSVAPVGDSEERLNGEGTLGKTIECERVIYESDQNVKFYIDSPSTAIGDKVRFENIELVQNHAGQIFNSQDGSWQEVRL